MRRPITDRERAAAQIEIDVRKRAVRYGLVQAFDARILDETNDDGEVVIEFTITHLPQIMDLSDPKP